MSDALNRDLATYHKLKTQRELIDAQLDVLNKRIKKRLAPNGKVDETVTYKSPDGHIGTLQMRKSRKQPDQGQLDQLMLEKGLFEKYAESHVTASAVEEAYLNDELTDADLRSLLGETKLSLALEVEELETNV